MVAAEPPEIQEMSASATTVDPGDTVQINVVAGDPENRSLTYKWQSTGGQFLPPTNSPTVHWVAPLVGGIFKIKVIVSNPDTSASDSLFITVRSYEEPYVKILSPLAGSFITQYQSHEVVVQAQHKNGINYLTVYLNDAETLTLSGHSQDQYQFELIFNVPAGAAEIKVEAVANSTFTEGADSVTVFIEGILPGKQN